jgi:hypothetical protein
MEDCKRGGGAKVRRKGSTTLRNINSCDGWPTRECKGNLVLVVREALLCDNGGGRGLGVVGAAGATHQPQALLGHVVSL